MARKPRLDKRGCLYHVMGRGNAGAAIFSDDEDRREFLGLLAAGGERFGHTVHAYCLMDNHFHLAIRRGEVPLSKIIPLSNT
jgi:putative transposase